MKLIRLILSALIACCFMFVGVANAAHSRHKSATKSVATVTQPININTADADSLVGLTGIGPRKAAAIVAYRNEHGAFKSAEDLTQVKGIGPGLLAKLKDKITV